MKQICGATSVVAWFKIADLIERGEKERALGVLRLLTHSFEDQALARQLEADVLRTFNEESALERYKDAIELYYTSQRLPQAHMLLEMISDFEHISYQTLVELIILSHTLKLSSTLISLYKKMMKSPEALDQTTQIKALAEHSIKLLSFDEQQALQRLLQTKS